MSDRARRIRLTPGTVIFSPYEVVAYVPLVARSNTRSDSGRHICQAERPTGHLASAAAAACDYLPRVQMAFRGRWAPILKRYFLIAFTMPGSVIHRRIFHCQRAAASDDDSVELRE